MAAAEQSLIFVISGTISDPILHIRRILFDPVVLQHGHNGFLQDRCVNAEVVRCMDSADIFA